MFQSKTMLIEELLQTVIFTTVKNCENHLIVMLVTNNYGHIYWTITYIF